MRRSIIQVVAASALLAAVGSLSIAQNDGNPSKSLYQAAMEADVEQIKLHIAKGTDVSARDGFGVPPLCYATEQSALEPVRLLLDAGADVNGKGVGGRTALMGAAQQGATEIVSLLLSKGADANAKDDARNTALHLAVQGGHKDTVQALINGGADVNALDGTQQTPLSVAQRRRQLEIGELLKQHGGTASATGMYDAEYGQAMPQGQEMPGRGPVVHTQIDPNAIRQQITEFEGLDAALQRVDANSVAEQKAWVQQRMDNRTTLQRAADKQFGEEMAFVKEIATAEKATKTVQGVDDLTARRKQRSDAIGDALRGERRAARQQGADTMGIGRGRAVGRGGRTRVGGAAAQGAGGLYGETGAEMPGRPRRAEPNEPPVDPETETLIQAWVGAKPEDKQNLLDAVHKVDLADLAGLRTIATEEQAKKTAAALSGLMLIREERMQKITTDSANEAARLQRLQERMGTTDGMIRGRGMRGTAPGAAGQGDQTGAGRDGRYR